MADLLKHPITVSLLSLLIGTFLGAFLTRFQNKTTILTWSSRTDRIALAAEDQIFGSVAVTWGGQAVQNLYLVSIAVENPSNRDFEDVELHIYSGNETILLNEMTRVEDSPNIVHWSEGFNQTLAVAPGAVATAQQFNTYHHSRYYSVPVFNRGQRLHFTYLCTRPGDAQEPGIYVSTQLKGAKLIRQFPTPMVRGAPLKHAAIRGSVIGLLVFFAVSLFVRNVWIASCATLVVGLFAQVLGAWQFRMERSVWKLIAG